MPQASARVVNINSRLGVSPPSRSHVQSLNVSYLDSVISAAIFDLNGLPKEYFVTSESRDGNWVQASFQALGLQSLLISSLRLEGFRYVAIHGKDYRAIVIRQKAHYLAVLVQVDEAVSPDFLQWAQAFEPVLLKSESRFAQV